MSIKFEFAIGWGVVATIMLLLWVRQYFSKNASTVDVAWAFGTGLLGVWFALTADGEVARRMMVALMVGIWGTRLGLHLWRRIAFEVEDGRYVALRQQLGERAQLVFFFFFQIQALWALLFALPVWAAATNETAGLHWHDVVGFSIWLIAIGGEMTADRQLQRFRSNSQNRGKVCQQGLWRYSRHPNYFFEWLHWWAYVLVGLGSVWWWMTWCGVVLMLIFLLKVTGIPHTERNALRKRGDAYREYQESTSKFFPLPPRKSHKEVTA
ncbi:MAG: DUF1295 domain-containing protein [Gammaproteobacteria bacterium]|nr:DUF1295 domain-containing protein [Gammaproteobacteria bacterium]